MPFICTIDGVTVTAHLKQIDVEPGGDGITGVGRLYFDQQAGGMDIRDMSDVRVWQTFNDAGAGIAERGRLFGGHVNLRDTGNVATTKLWRLTCWDYNVIGQKLVRDVQPNKVVTLSAGTFAAQIAALGDVLQYNGHGFGSPPPTLIDWSTGVEDLWATMPAVNYEGGHNANWYIKQLCNAAQLLSGSLRPTFYFGVGNTFGVGDVFGNPVLWVYDAATMPAATVEFSDAPTGGQKSIFGTFRRVDDSTLIVQRQQSVWNDATVSTGHNDPSQSTYPNPYINHGGASNSGYWMDEAIVDHNSISVNEAQSAIDRVVAAKANPKETFTWETYERILPGETVKLTWALEGISAQTYWVAKAKFLIEDPDKINTLITANNRRLLLFDDGLQGISGLPVEGGQLPPGVFPELQNPSFEHLRLDGTAYNWTVTNTGAGLGTVDRTTAAEGQNSFHFYTPSPSDQVLLTSDIFKARYLDSGDIGARFYLDLKMKRGATNINSIDIYVDWYDQSLAIVDTETLVSGLSLLTTFSSYHYPMPWPGTTPENVVAARLRFHSQPMSGAYDWWIDSLQVEQEVTPQRLYVPGGTTSHPWVEGGNAFGALGVLGTTDAEDLSIITDGVERVHIDKATGYTRITTSNVSGDALDSFATDPLFVAAIGATGSVGEPFGASNPNMETYGVYATGAVEGDGSISPNSCGVYAEMNVQGVTADSTVLNGIRAVVFNSSLVGTSVGDIISVNGAHNTSPNQPATRAISIYGAAQTAGAANWSGYFDGNVYINGNLTVTGTGGGGSGHTIQDEGTPLTARANLNFIGPGVVASDDAANSATKVQVSRWEPLTNGDGTTPELIFDSFGDVIMVEITT